MERSSSLSVAHDKSIFIKFTISNHSFTELHLNAHSTLSIRNPLLTIFQNF